MTATCCSRRSYSTTVSYVIFERLIKQETSLFRLLRTAGVRRSQERLQQDAKITMPKKRYPIIFNVTLTIPNDLHEFDMLKKIQALDIILQVLWTLPSAKLFGWPTR